MARVNGGPSSQKVSLPVQKIIDASGGNNSLRQILTSIAQVQQQQASVSNTGTKNAPPQLKGQVSYLTPNYIIELTLPGAQSPTSVLQAQQIASSLSPQTNVTPIYNQIQAATSPSFSESSNVTLYGGNTGSTMTYWTIADLAAGQWYFRFRSSYDGVNWNQWKNANGGKALNGTAESVTVEPVTNGVAAVFQLPGSETVAFVAGLVADQGTFSLPEYLFTGSMAAISSPNGYQETGNDAHGWNCSIGYNGTPPSGAQTSPPVVLMEYSDGSHDTWSGSANIFAFAWNPLGTNWSYYRVTQGGWGIFTLGGGAQIAIGSGVVNDGGNIELPPGFSSANWQVVASANSGFSSGNHAHGVVCSVAGTTVTSEFHDGSGNVWSATATWFAVAYLAGMPVTAVTGGSFVVLNTPGGSKIAIGSGNVASSSGFTLPAGFNFTNSLVFAAPSSYNDTGNPMHGVAVCGADLGRALLRYQDGQGDTWDGNVGWFCFAWQ
jgi:hypothetical protein